MKTFIKPPFQPNDILMPSESVIEKKRQEMIKYCKGTQPYNMRKQWMEDEKQKRVICLECKSNKYCPMVLYYIDKNGNKGESDPSRWQIAPKI